MATRYRRPIVVGVDGTDAGQAAVRWAAAEARLRAAPLRIIGAYEPVSLAGPLPIPSSLRYRFDDALHYARRRLDAEEVAGELIPGHPSRVLRAEARNARLVVLGRRTGGVRSALSVERVTSWVAAHAVCRWPSYGESLPTGARAASWSAHAGATRPRGCSSARSVRSCSAGVTAR